jgi:hypothetical protein
MVSTSHPEITERFLQRIKIQARKIDFGEEGKREVFLIGLKLT